MYTYLRLFIVCLQLMGGIASEYVSGTTYADFHRILEYIVK